MDIAALRAEKDASVVRHAGDRVRLATSDRVAIVLALVAHAILFGAFLVTMWTKLAVVETRLDNLKDTVGDIQKTVERNSSVMLRQSHDGTSTP